MVWLLLCFTDMFAGIKKVFWRGFPISPSLLEANHGTRDGDLVINTGRIFIDFIGL